MIRIALLGAGSSVFARNVLGDILSTPGISECRVALYDIDSARLRESRDLVLRMNADLNGSRAVVSAHLGPENRREALRDADFVLNTVQVGGYEPCTVTDFEIPRKYGLLQTIGDTLGIGGIMRALRTVPVMRAFAEDMEEVCPDALFLNYTNPMAMLTGYMLRATGIKTVGLCHSVQSCARELLEPLGMEWRGARSLVAGINHMAWLLELTDAEGRDLYPAAREAALARRDRHADMVRYEYLRRLGYYVTESSEHNAEYNPWFIKSLKPELIERYNIPIDEYLRRCVRNRDRWEAVKAKLLEPGSLAHARSKEYAADIVKAVVLGGSFEFNGNVLNEGSISNLPDGACVEVPCVADGLGLRPLRVGALPPQCAALNLTSINVQNLVIEAAITGKREHVYHAAMLDPHTAAELSLDEICAMVDELIAAHGDWMPKLN